MADVPSRAARRRILLVDDDSLFREVVVRHLEQAGHQVMDVDSVDGALGCLRDALPDLLITDIHMPVRDGLELMREVRKDYPGVRIVAMSGGLAAATDPDARARELGADGFLAKPFSRRQLFEACCGA